MKHQPNKQLREQIVIIILTSIDLMAGILSIVFSQLAIQVIATLASGATLVKAIKMAKASKIIKAINVEQTVVKVAVKAIPAVAMAAAKCIHKISKKENCSMKKFLQKLKAEIKNNPVTLITALFEAGCCGGGGYAIYRYLLNFSAKIPHPWNIVLTVAITFIVYAALAIATIYLGHDSEAFAAIRKLVKAIGGDKAVDCLNEVESDIEAQLQAKAEKERLEAEIAAKQEEIKAKIIAEEKQREQEEWERKIAIYLANHPEEGKIIREKTAD